MAMKLCRSGPLAAATGAPLFGEEVPFIEEERWLDAALWLDEALWLDAARW